MSTVYHNNTFDNLNLALVHDWLNQIGGAENVLEEFNSLFPIAPIYTSMYAPALMPSRYQAWDIRTSFMQRLPSVTTHHQRYLPLYPLAFAQTDLSEYDLILSNKSGFCHGVGSGLLSKPKNRPVHICYCLTPTRYLWLYEQYREREQIGGLLNVGLQPLLAMLRRWDRAVAQDVDYFIAISSEVQKRIRDIYGRESVIIHPPVNTHVLTPDTEDTSIGDYYLMLGRLIPYKRVDLAIAAFNQLPHEKLIIVGDGRDRDMLEAQAGDNIQFMGRLSNDDVLPLLQHCKAFLFPGLEDFGIAPVEAMSAGRPVIAYAGGGALDTVVPGVTGELFDEQTPESLQQVVESFDPSAYDPMACRAQAERFSVTNFREKIMNYVAEVAATRFSSRE
ncbi:MAG: glycosyltransferase [Chloroflexota bacterium]